MQTGDGLLARIRVQSRTLSTGQLAQLARLAIQHGNGILEISARGNLQARGLTAATAPLFAQAVTCLVPLENGLVVDTSPLAGDDPSEISDPLPLAAQIRAGAIALKDKLGPKVTVIIDGGGQISLSSLKADIRLLALDATHWAVHLGGGKPQIMDAEGAVAATLAVLGALAALGPEARAGDLFPEFSTSTPHPSPPHKGEGAGPVLAENTAGHSVQHLPPRGGGWEGGSPTLQTLTGHTSPVALPFGQMHGDALIALAEAAEANGVTKLRLAPAHTLLLDNAPAKLIEIAGKLGFITDPSDPRRRVSACIGTEGCASGHIPARRLAAELAPLTSPDQHLHVSGCTKGCAHPRPSAITLVGRSDGIGLVIDGRAGDTPQHILDEAGLAPALAARQEAR